MLLQLNNPLVGKQVVVTMLDGFKKFGLLLEYNDTYLLLQFNDGRIERINNPNNTTKGIVEDRKNGEVKL